MPDVQSRYLAKHHAKQRSRWYAQRAPRRFALTPDRQTSNLAPLISHVLLARLVRDPGPLCAFHNNRSLWKHARGREHVRRMWAGGGGGRGTQQVQQWKCHERVTFDTNIHIRYKAAELTQRAAPGAKWSLNVFATSLAPRTDVRVMRGAASPARLKTLRSILTVCPYRGYGTPASLVRYPFVAWRRLSFVQCWQGRLQ
jgi:hypothetical protein